MEILLQNGERLDLPPDLQLSISQKNPLLSEQGTYSLQVSLPATPRNIRLLGHPDRLDGYYKFITKAPAFVKQGIFQKKATMCLLEGGGDPGNDDIDATFLMNESEMYAAMKETSLSAAFAIKRQASEFLPGMTFTDDVDRLVKYMELVKQGNFTDDFFIFTVATDTAEDTVNLAVLGNYNIRVSEQINGVKWDTGNGSTWYDYDLNGIKYAKLKGFEPYIIRLDGKDIEVPKGYGISPFLRLSYVLRRIFKYFGYTLTTNIFDTDPELSLVVVINNTADAIINGLIDYTQLVPDGTIDEFLENIRQAFACEFFISPDNEKVDIKFWNDILSTIRMERDYTPYLSGIPRITYTELKTVKLTFQRSNDFSSVPYDTLEGFEQAFGQLGYLIDTSNINYPQGFYYIKKLNQIWELVYYKKDNIQLRTFRFHSYPLFNYYIDSDNMKYDEHFSSFEFTPIVRGYVLSKATDFYYFNDSYLIFIGKSRNMNTVLQETTNSQITVTKESYSECKPMIAFCRTRNDASADIKVIVTGTPYRYDDAGNEVGAFDLIPGGDYGLFNTFYKSLDNMLRNSNHLVTVPLKLPEAEIAAYRNDRLICVNNQPLLPDTLEYIVGEKNIDVNKATFRTVRPYFDRE